MPTRMFWANLTPFSLQAMVAVGFGPLLRRQGVLRGVLPEARCVEIEAHSMTPPYDNPASFEGGVCAATLHNDEYQSPMCARRAVHRVCPCRVFFVTAASLQ